MARQIKFPSGFFWGASTSSHQVEGGNNNDWTEWEIKNAKRLAEEAKQNYQIWQLELFPEALDPKNYISGKATDHYNKFKEDFDLVKSLGHNAHRFSIEWSRVEPEEGKFNKDEIEHYRKVIAELRRKGIEPIVTLWHWTLPVWLANIGGWGNRKSIRYFSRYVAKVANELGGEVKYWITINEPTVYAGNSYLKGKWPPQRKNPRLYFRVLRHLSHAHRHAANTIKIIDQDAMVGIASHNIYFEAARKKAVNKAIKKAADWWWNYHFLNEIRKHIDFIGLNVYFHSRINYGINKNLNMNVSDMGWELYPEAVYQTLKGLKRYRKPVIVTENGLADAKDAKREKYIKEALLYVHKAIADGVNVIGYLYWSLLDNFEWDRGFWPRFGLIEIDYEDSLKRKVRGSAKEYSKIIKANAILSE